MLTSMTLLARLCTGLMVGLIAAPAWAQSTSERIDALITELHERGRFEGAVLVAREGEVVYEGGRGLADATWGIPNAPDVKYPLASITKTFTAVLVLQQVDRGVLRLDAPAADYLPDFPAPIDPRITIEHLLTHQSGLLDFVNDLPRDEVFMRYARQPLPPDSAVADMARRPLEFEPGARSDYGNTGYNLLGLVLETVTGRSYCALLQAQVFGPAGMRDSGCIAFEPVVPRMATPYLTEDEALQHVTYDHSLFADGSAYSTVRDLFRFDQALRVGQLLPRELQAEMAAPRVRDEWISEHYGTRPELAYGYGVATWESPGSSPSDRVQVVGHGGAAAGVTTVLWRIPEEGVVIALLNNRSIWPFPTYLELIDVLYGRASASASTEPPGQGRD